MMRLHCLLSFGAAPVCSSFSVAVAPPVRNQQYPRGIPGARQSMREKVRDCNRYSDFIKDAIDVAEEEDMVYFVENPDTSWFWRQRRWRRFRDSHAGTLFRCCFCRFGTPGWPCCIEQLYGSLGLQSYGIGQALRPLALQPAASSILPMLEWLQ
jgi:hypothetical protein